MDGTAGTIIPVSANRSLAIDAEPVGSCRSGGIECRDRAVGSADKPMYVASHSVTSGDRAGVVDAVRDGQA